MRSERNKNYFSPKTAKKALFFNNDEEIVTLINSLSGKIKNYYKITKKSLLTSKLPTLNESLSREELMLIISQSNESFSIIDLSLNKFIADAKNIFAKLKLARKNEQVEQTNNFINFNIFSPLSSKNSSSARDSPLKFKNNSIEVKKAKRNTSEEKCQKPEKNEKNEKSEKSIPCLDPKILGVTKEIIEFLKEINQLEGSLFNKNWESHEKKKKFNGMISNMENLLEQIFLTNPTVKYQIDTAESKSTKTRENSKQKCRCSSASKTRNSSIEKINEKYNSQLMLKDVTIKKFEEDVKLKNNTIHKHNVLICKLKENIQNLQSKLKEKDEAIRDLKIGKSSRDDFVAINKQSALETKKLQDMNTKLKFKIDKLNSENKEKEKTIQQLNEKCEKIKQDHSTLPVPNLNLNNLSAFSSSNNTITNEALESKIKTLEEANTKFQNEIKDYLLQITDLKEKVKESKASAQEVKESTNITKQSAPKAGNQIKQLQNELKLSSEKLMVLEKKNKSLEDTKISLETELKESKKEHLSVISKLEEEKKSKELETKARISELQSKLDEQINLYDVLKNELNEKNNSLSKTNEEITTLNDKVALLQSNLFHAESELKSKNSPNPSCKILGKLSLEDESSKDEVIQSYKNNLLILKNENEKFVKEVAKLKNELNNRNQMYTDLQARYMKEKTTFIKEMKSMDNQVNDMKLTTKHKSDMLGSLANEIENLKENVKNKDMQILQLSSNGFEGAQMIIKSLQTEVNLLKAENKKYLDQVTEMNQDPSQDHELHNKKESYVNLKLTSSNVSVEENETIKNSYELKIKALENKINSQEKEIESMNEKNENLKTEVQAAQIQIATLLESQQSSGLSSRRNSLDPTSIASPKVYKIVSEFCYQSLVYFLLCKKDKKERVSYEDCRVERSDRLKNKDKFEVDKIYAEKSEKINHKENATDKSKFFVKNNSEFEGNEASKKEEISKLETDNNTIPYEKYEKICIELNEANDRIKQMSDIIKEIKKQGGNQKLTTNGSSQEEKAKDKLTALYQLLSHELKLNSKTKNILKEIYLLAGYSQEDFENISTEKGKNGKKK